MESGMAFTAGLRLLIITVLILIQLHPTASTLMDNHDDDHYCAPSCGNVPNISYPFRLKGDPPNCGLHRYELSCDENNRTILSLRGDKYYVQHINYNNYTIRVVNSRIQENNYSFTPRNFLRYNGWEFWPLRDLYSTYVEKKLGTEYLSEAVAIVSCEKPVLSWASSFHLVTNSTNCFVNIKNGYVSSSNSSVYQYSKRFVYLIFYGGNVMEVEESCTIEQTFLTSFAGEIKDDDPNNSCTDIRNLLSYGFELSWFRLYCESCARYPHYCFLDDHNQAHCDPHPSDVPADHAGPPPSFGDIFLSIVKSIVKYLVAAVYRPGLQTLIVDSGYFEIYDMGQLPFLVYWRCAMTIIGTPFVVAFLIYKWRRRHLSMYDAVEEFLQNHNNLTTIRYSFSEIKKMTKNFKDKLGEGGYGTVFKGTLRSGRFVAVKMLGKSQANGQDFINEVATIGRIHHVNVVQLIGFCVQGLKRALVYELMPHGSLNKYLFSSEETILLNYEKIYNIALGVAHGIEYLHRGCDVQILHFDIKPHNILLDENFIPKVSDFGLAKFYPTKDNTISLTAARGTLGYMAPELFYKNIGGISYKADVYSFGMLLMEMVGKRKNLNVFAEHSSQIYFPTWVYDQFNEGKNIDIEGATKKEKEIIKKMIIVALWCIQTNPNNRPSMNTVVRMLEGEVEHLQIPSRAPLSSPERVIKVCDDNSSKDWLSSQTLPSSF